METISKLKRAASSLDSNLVEDGQVPPKRGKQNEMVGLFNNNLETFRDDSQKTEEYHLGDTESSLSTHGSVPLLESVEDDQYGFGELETLSQNGSHISLEHSQVKSPQKNFLCETFSRRLTKIPSLQRDAEAICDVIPHAKLSAVYKKLEQNRNSTNRMDIVFTDILDGSEDFNQSSTVETDLPNCSRRDSNTVTESVNTNAKESEKDLVTDNAEGDSTVFRHSDRSIFDEVSQVMEAVPESNPNEVYSLLETLEAEDSRVDQVIKQLNGRKIETEKCSLKKDESFPDDPALRNDPVFCDMRIISKMFPDKDRNEIYAYVEAHHDKLDRVQRVIEELLKSGSGSQDQSLTHDEPESNMTSPPHTMHRAFRLQDEVDNLREIFPDCDPNYIFEELEKRSDDQERVKNIASHMFEKRDYPKLKDVLAKQTKLALKNHLNRLKFNMNIFLSKFNDPLTTFYDCRKSMTQNYKDHCLNQLKNDFPRLKDGYIKSVLESNNFHYTPARKELQKQQALLLGISHFIYNVAITVLHFNLWSIEN